MNAINRVLNRNEVQEPEASIQHEYLSWFERDQELLRRECDQLASSNIYAECSQLNDGRIAFSVKVDEKQIVVICSYHHPIEPPEVVVVNAEPSDSIADEAGIVNLFAGSSFAWAPCVSIAQVVNHVKTLLTQDQPED